MDDLSVANRNKIKMTLAKKNGEETGYLPAGADLDMEIGDACDFELKVRSNEWNAESLGYGCRLFSPGSEYGGIIKDIESNTGASEVILRGPTWRGMLLNKIIEPPEGQEHLVLSGDLNDILRALIKDEFDGLFDTPEIKTGINVSNWKVDRYVKMYDAMTKLLSAYGYRVKIEYNEPEDLEYGHVDIRAVPIVDYSNDLEYSMDGNVYVDVRDCRNGVNHLICIGEGEGQDRIKIDLYVQEDGTLGKNQYYFGAEEIEDVYNFTSADAESLEEDGRKRLQELRNYKKCNMTIDDADVEIGDIVAGFDIITGTIVKKPIIRKILKIQNEIITIEYETKGDD